MGAYERSGAVHPDGWSGDLREFALTAWAEDGDVAATVVVVDNHAAGWLNLRHCRVEHWPLIWMRLRSLAAHAPPFGVVYAPELAALVTGEQAQEA